MIASKGRSHPAFEHYDPFTDQRVDPRHAEDLDQHPDLPDCLHDAVARAKRLTGPLTEEESTGSLVTGSRPRSVA